MNSGEFLQGLVQGTANFDLLVTELMSANNDSRKAAEAIFQDLKKHPDACLSNLVRGLGSFPSVESRSYCAIILRKVITSKEDLSVWTDASGNVQSMVKSELLRSLSAEPERSVVTKVCDTIYELGDLLLPDSNWPELLPCLLGALQHGDSAPRITESALTILGDIAEAALEALSPDLPRLYPLLATHLASTDKALALAALHASGSLIAALEEEVGEQRKLQPLVPPMLQVLTAALNSEDEASARDALELFIELAESNPKFLRPHLASCVDVFLSIARAEALDPETRILAVVFLVTLCEARERAPGMMRKLPSCVQSLFQTLMQFLLDVEDEEAWHTTEEEDDTCGEGELAQVGQECLDRLAMALKGKSLVPPAAQLLAAWFVDADWKKRHACLLCLAQIAEGCDKVMLEQLDGLVSMCLKGLQDPHPRVRWAACQALGQMCSDLGPDLQDRCHAVVVPALMKAMEGFESPRVQAHAAAALVNFSEGCEPELLSPYLDTLIVKLQALLQQGKKMVQEGALTALASVADAAQAHFIRYYDEVMPKLIHVLLHAADKSHRLLRAKALECVSLVGMAVGRDKFRADALVVMSFMQKLQAGGMEADDPTSSYMLQAGARLCKCLGEEVLPYLPFMLPPLLATASQQPDVKVQSAEDAVEEEEDDDDMEHVQVGDKLLSIRTSVLEEKATACNMLCCYADELKAGFYPYVQDTAPLMVGLLKFYFHEEVRRAAVQSLPSMLRSVSLAVAAGQADAGVLKELAEFCWPPLLAAMKKEPDNDVLASMVEAAGEMVEVLGGGGVHQAWVEQSFAVFKDVMEGSEKRRKERLQGADDGEALDEEDREALEGREEEESELLDAVSSATGAMLKVFGDAVLPYVEALMPLLAALLAPTRSPQDRRIAICVVDDLIDNSPAGRDKYAAQSLPILLECSGSSDVDLRQCAVFGLGIAAVKAPAVFKPFCTQAVQALVAVMQAPGARSHSNGRAADNAASSLGKVLEAHPECPDSAALTQLWLAYLPLKDDKEEACIVHEQLLRLVEAGEARVVGHSLPRVAEVFVEVLAQGSKLVDRAVAPRVAGLLHKCGAQVGAALQAAMGRLGPEELQRFQAAMAGQFAD